MENKDKRQDRKKFWMLLLSILISLSIWTYVDMDQGITVTTTIENIPIEFLGEDTALADRGLMVIESDSDTTLTLTLEGTREWIARLEPAKVRVQVNLSDITTTGTQAVAYKIIYPSVNGREEFSKHLSLQSVSPPALSVDIGELYSRKIDVRYDIQGKVADGYIAGEVQLQPETLEIRGQQEDIDKVSYAKVTLSIDNAEETVSQALDYTFYDENDQELSGTGIHATVDQVQATLPVSVVKELELTMKFVESPGYSLSNVEYTITPSTITVSGDAAKLKNQETITLDEFNLSKLSNTTTYSYSITVPDGCKNLSGVTRATLRIAFKDMTTSTLAAAEIQCKNEPEGKSVTVLTNELNVEICGTTEDVASVKAEDLTVIADLNDVSSASGSYTVPATVKIDTDKDVGVVGTYQVNVTIADSVPAEEEEGTTAETGGETQIPTETQPETEPQNPD